MITQDLIDLFRKQVSDVDEPRLWDDIEVFQYLVDAQDMFVRKMGGFSDYTTTALTDIAVVKGQPFTKHSKYILRIRSGKFLNARKSVDFISEADLTLKINTHTATNLIGDYGWTLPSFMDDHDVGPVRWGILGVQDHAIRWWRVPPESDTVRLHIYRLPYPRMVDEDSELEIDEQHHLHLIMWMKYLAYSKEDAETYDKDLSERNKAAFLEYCDMAKAEKDRQRFKPRIVHYGGY